MINCKVVDKPYPHVLFNNGMSINFNKQYETREHNLRNAMVAAKVFNDLNDFEKEKVLEVIAND